MSNLYKRLFKNSPFHSFKHLWIYFLYKIRMWGKKNLKPISWSNIRAAGQLKIISFTAAVPFIGYLIIANKEFSDFIDQTSILRHIPTYNPWKLILFYWGILFSGAGYLIYSSRCPKILKKYDGFVSYIERERFLWKTLHFAEMKITNLETEERKYIADSGIYVGTVSSRQAHHFTRFRRILISNGIVVEDRVDEFLLAEWELFDHSRPSSRLFCVILYSIGAMLILIPSLKVFYDVLILTINWVKSLSFIQ